MHSRRFWGNFRSSSERQQPPFFPNFAEPKRVIYYGLAFGERLLVRAFRANSRCGWQMKLMTGMGAECAPSIG
jgi:hypothetical protein